MLTGKIKYSIIFIFCFQVAVSLGSSLDVPAEFPTIQAALDAASWDDSVVVASGEYHGVGNTDLDFHGKRLTLLAPTGPDSTIIDCDGQSRGFQFISGENGYAVVDGFTVRNGLASGQYPDNAGGAVLCRSFSTPTLRNCIFTGNTARFGGGISCTLYSSPVISNTSITGNHADWYGGGMYCYNHSDPMIEGCNISENSSGTDGGGISCEWYSNPLVSDCEINLNETPYGSGGGVLCTWYSSATFDECTVSHNNAIMYGGGIQCKHESTPVITDCLISVNTASFGAGILSVDDSSPEITGCRLFHNSAYADGGGLYLRDGSILVEETEISNNSAVNGGGIYGYFGSNPVIDDCKITGNEADCGGGAFCYYSQFDVTNSEFIGNNSESEGGALYIWKSSPTFTGCRITENYAGTKGGGAMIDNEASPRFINTLFAGNESEKVGGGMDASYSTVELRFCDFVYNNSGGRGGGVYCMESTLQGSGNIVWYNIPNNIHNSSGSVELTYSDVKGGLEGEGNIDIDPLVTPGNDYHLLPGSPCIDAAVDTGDSTDIDRETRPLGEGFDMGSDEFSGSAPKLLISEEPEEIPVGGTLSFEVVVEDTMDWDISFDMIYEDVSGPATTGVIIYSGADRKISSGSSMTGHVNQPVPGTALPGLYRIEVSALSEGVTMAVDSFFVSVTGDSVIGYDR